MKKLINLIFRQSTKLPSWVGGLIIIHQEVFAIVGLLTFAGVMNGFWLDHLQWHPYFFNNFLFFLLCFIPPLELAGLLYYKFMVHARQKYQQYQMFSLERSNLYREVITQGKKIDAIIEKLGLDVSEIEKAPEVKKNAS